MLNLFGRNTLSDSLAAVILVRILGNRLAEDEQLAAKAIEETEALEKANPKKRTTIFRSYG